LIIIRVPDDSWSEKILAVEEDTSNNASSLFESGNFVHHARMVIAQTASPTVTRKSCWVEG